MSYIHIHTYIHTHIHVYTYSTIGDGGLSKKCGCSAWLMCPTALRWAIWRLSTRGMQPIIQSHVNPGTTVHSDQWAAYNNVATIPGIAGHQTVNHSVEFVAPNRTNTRHIESYWNRVKGNEGMPFSSTGQLP